MLRAIQLVTDTKPKGRWHKASNENLTLSDVSFCRAKLDVSQRSSPVPT